MCAFKIDDGELKLGIPEKKNDFEQIDKSLYEKVSDLFNTHVDTEQACFDIIFNACKDKSWKPLSEPKVNAEITNNLHNEEGSLSSSKNDFRRKICHRY